MSTAAAIPLLHREPLAELPVEHLFDMGVDLEPVQVVPMNIGIRMNYVVRQGKFEGPGLRGEVLPGLGDGLLVGSDQIGRVRVRATLRTTSTTGSTSCCEWRQCQ